MDFTGKCAISTGAASGMGLLFAQNFAELGGNVTSVHHERANEGTDVNGCYLRIVMETRNYDHVQEIIQALGREGFRVSEEF